MPSASFDVTRAYRGLDKVQAFIRITLGSSETAQWSGTALTDRSVYEQGYKQAKLMMIEDLVVALSDRSRAIQASRFSFQVSDVPDETDPSLGGAIRGWLGLGKTLKNAEIVCKFITDAQRRLEYDYKVAFRGVVQRYSSVAGFQLNFECIGWIGPRLDQPVVEDVIGDSWPNAPADVFNRPAPLCFGVLSDAGSTGSSPSPVAEASSGATDEAGPGDLNAVAGYGSISGGPSAPTGVALTEVAAGDFLTGDHLYVQVWKSLASVEGDPDAASFAYGSTGVDITIGADNKAIKATCTDDGDGAIYRFSIGVFYAGRVRYSQILETLTPAVGVTFTTAPGAAGTTVADELTITPGSTLPLSQIWNYTVTTNLSDGETVVSNSWISIVAPYQRPTRMVFTPVATAINYFVYRGFLSVYERKKSVSVLNVNGAGNNFAEDTFTAGEWELTGPPIERGRIAPIPVGPVVDAVGGSWQLCFTYAKHACDISTPVKVYIIEGDTVTPVDPSRYGVDVAAPGQPGYSTYFGSNPYWTQPDGSRWMIIAYRGTDYQDFLDGTKTLRANVLGAEPVGDGSGDVITDGYDLLALVADNLTLLDDDSVLGANWRTTPPTFNDGTQKRDTASWTLAKTNALSVLPEGNDCSRYLVEEMTWGNFLAEALKSLYAYGGINTDGKLQIVVPYTGQSVAGTVTHKNEIRDQSFTWKDDDTDFANAQPYTFNPDYETSSDKGTLEAGPTLEDTDSQDRNQQRSEAENLEMVWREDPVQAQAVATLNLAETTDLPRTVELGSGIHWSQYKLGDILKVTHPEGPRALGYDEDHLQIMGLRLNLEDMTVDATCIDRKGFVNIVIDPVTTPCSSADQDLTLTATLTDVLGNPINEGTFTFKILDANGVQVGSELTVNVVAGIATGTWTMPGGIGH